MKRQFQAFNFSIRNASNDSVDIYIDGQIVDAETQELWAEWFGDTTSVSFKSFRTQLNAVKAKTYNVYINSGGGLVTDAMAIHDLLEQKESQGIKINRIGQGIIASAATYILMGKGSSMTKNSWFMIHNCSGFAWGDVNAVESMAQTLRKFNNQVRDFYAAETGLSKEEISNMMDAETWMTADEAKERGFIKNVTNETSFTNLIAKENWQFNNHAVLNAYNASVKPAQPSPNSSIQNQLDEMKKFFQDLGNSIMNAIKGIKAPENNDHAALMSSIGEAVNSAFKDAGEQMEAAVTEAAGKAVTDAVKTTVENAVKDYETRIKNLENAKADLEKRNDELEQEIANKLGQGSNTTKENDAPKAIGSFK